MRLGASVADYPNAAPPGFSGVGDLLPQLGVAPPDLLAVKPFVSLGLRWCPPDGVGPAPGTALFRGRVALYPPGLSALEQTCCDIHDAYIRSLSTREKVEAASSAW
jgi:hypothetical protein